MYFFLNKQIVFFKFVGTQSCKCRKKHSSVAITVALLINTVYFISPSVPLYKTFVLLFMKVNNSDKALMNK